MQKSADVCKLSGIDKDQSYVLKQHIIIGHSIKMRFTAELNLSAILNQGLVWIEMGAI